MSPQSSPGIIKGFSDVCSKIHLERREQTPVTDDSKACTDPVVTDNGEGCNDLLVTPDSKMCTHLVVTYNGKLLCLNLDHVLWNHNGKFHWGDLGEWTESVYRAKGDDDKPQGSLGTTEGSNNSTHDSENQSNFDPTLVTRTIQLHDAYDETKKYDHRRTTLHARLQLSDGSWRHSSIDLDDHIVVKDGSLVAKGIRSRTIVLCFDGTGNEYDDTNTNVVYLMNQLQKADPTVQHVYYQDGIGTYVNGDWWGSVSASIAKTVDTMVAWSLDDHVRAGYKFLTGVYKPGDKISVFGFSRGAHTARAVVAMVNAVGLLPAHNEVHIPFAFNCYKKSATAAGSTLCKDFRQTFSQVVDVYFVGIWDTVNSTGFFPRVLPGTDENPQCRYFRHALALDERRVKFWPTAIQAPVTLVDKSKVAYVKQVWFPGNHCDVGGGNRPNREGVSISNVALRWMVKQCFECKTDIMFVAQKPLESNKAIWDKVKQRAVYINNYMDRKDNKRVRMPKNEWPNDLWTIVDEQDHNLELYEWPRVRMAVDQQTGSTCLLADVDSAEIDKQDIHYSLRHDTVFYLKWILMEFLPFPVLRPQVYTPKDRETLSGNQSTHKGEKPLYFQQSLTFVANRCSGRNVYPESDGMFHLHESVGHLWYGPEVSKPWPTPEGLTPTGSDHAPLLRDGTNYEPAVSFWRPWTWWDWLTSKRDVDHYECAATFCFRTEDAGGATSYRKVYLEQLVKHHYDLITWHS